MVSAPSASLPSPSPSRQKAGDRCARCRGARPLLRHTPRSPLRHARAGGSADGSTKLCSRWHKPSVQPRGPRDGHGRGGGRFFEPRAARRGAIHITSPSQDLPRPRSGSASPRRFADARPKRPGPAARRRRRRSPATRARSRASSSPTSPTSTTATPSAGRRCASPAAGRSASSSTRPCSRSRAPPSG